MIIEGMVDDTIITDGMGPGVETTTHILNLISALISQLDLESKLVNQLDLESKLVNQLDIDSGLL